MRHIFLAYAPIAVAFLGCGDPKAHPSGDAEVAAPDAASDAAAPLSDATAPIPDAGPGYVPLTCVCESGETCGDCFDRIGECCYDDATLGGMVGPIAQTCEAAGACRACCHECAALTCDQIRAAGACPIMIPSDVAAARETNGIMFNGGPFDALPTAALSTEGLTDNAALRSVLDANPEAAHVFQYLVECALPEGASFVLPVAGEDRTFSGSMGLAPEWATGVCDVTCQRWVSACLFARTNAFGLPVGLYFSGPHPSLAAQTSKDGGPAANGFPLREGAFYGNMFGDLARRFDCRGDGYDPLFVTVRRCSQPGSACGAAHVGTCGDVDGNTGLATSRHACDGESATGDYTGCHARASLPDGSFPDGAPAIEEVLTAWIRPTDFMAGVEALNRAGPSSDCGPGMPPAEMPLPGPDVVVGRAGAPCQNDDVCGPPPLVCDTQSLQGLCTAPCAPSDDAAVEAAACGGDGSTCLQLGDSAFCTAACKVAAPPGEPGACAPGQMCSARWVLYAMPDPTPGCLPACTQDADCPPLVPCQTRLLNCGASVDVTRLPDGEPCDARQGEVCRGACIVLGADPEKGVCGSLITATTAQQCPDDPANILPLGPGGFGRKDDLGLCLFRSCRVDAECTAPLKCRTGVIQGLRTCAWE